MYKISLTESFRNTLNRLDTILLESNREMVDEYLTPDEKAQVDQWKKRTPQATKATDPYFGVGNDEINEPLVGGKSDIHRAIEKDIGVEIPPESYKSGMVKDKSGKQQRIGTLISEPSLRNAYKTDNTRKNVKTNDLSVTTTRSPHGVAGQTSHGQSWEQASCKNFNDGANSHFLCQEFEHGTVVVYLKDKDGTELARGTLQPYINKQGVYQYRLNGFYGDKNPMFIKYIKHLERKLSHEHKGDEIYNIHPDVYDDRGSNYTFPYEANAIKNAVSRDWRALKDVPEDILQQHPEIYEIAVKSIKNAVSKNGRELKYVPAEVQQQHPELCMKAVDEDWRALYYVPKEVAQQHPAIYKRVVKERFNILGYMTSEEERIRYGNVKELITPELCKIAIQNRGSELREVPPEILQQHPELYKIAVSESSSALEYVPEEMRTLDFYKYVLSKNGQFLYEVPEEMKTLPLCKIAVKNDGIALEYVPPEILQQHPELYKMAVSQNGDALYDVPEELRDYELCRIAVSTSDEGYALKNVPPEILQQHPELYKMAVSQNGDALQYVPEELRDYELCRIAVGKSGRALYYVPAEVQQQHPELCEIAVGQSGLLLAAVPKELRTRELWSLAYRTIRGPDLDQFMRNK